MARESSVHPASPSRNKIINTYYVSLISQLCKLTLSLARMCAQGSRLEAILSSWSLISKDDTTETALWDEVDDSFRTDSETEVLLEMELV